MIMFLVIRHIRCTLGKDSLSRVVQYLTKGDCLRMLLPTFGAEPSLEPHHLHQNALPHLDMSAPDYFARTPWHQNLTAVPSLWHCHTMMQCAKECFPNCWSDQEQLSFLWAPGRFFHILISLPTSKVTSDRCPSRWHQHRGEQVPDRPSCFNRRNKNIKVYTKRAEPTRPQVSTSHPTSNSQTMVRKFIRVAFIQIRKNSIEFPY